MNLVRHQDPRAFLARTEKTLLSAEAENHLMLGILGTLTRSPAPPPAQTYLVTAEDERGFSAAAAMTPPNKLVVTRGDAAGLDLIADDLLRSGTAIPAVIGPSQAALVFAEMYAAKSGMAMHRGLFMLIYQLDRVEKHGGAAGKLRPAQMEDMERLSAWGSRFIDDTGVDESADKVGGMTLGMIREGRLYVWDDAGEIKSMAAWAGETPNGARINYVYTPPEFRRRGYGTSCVSALCSKLLQGGKKFCFLFADLASPVSNSIYRRIGFEPVCEFREYSFNTSSLDANS